MRTPKILGALALSLVTIATTQSATIGSLVWNDLNQNGIQETNEPGLTNITVQLFDCTTTNLVTSVQSTEGGAFSLEGAFPSNVFLRVVLPTGYLVTDRDQGSDDSLDSDFDPITGSTHCFTLDCTDPAGTNCIQTNWAVGLFQPIIGVVGPGFWKTHPESWPVTNITIAGVTYASSNAFELMRNGADKSLTLFRALLTARLNELAGADASCITQELAEAEMWLEDFPRGSNVRGPSEAWKLAAPIVMRLEAYNDGLLCAPAREEDDEDDDDDDQPAGPPRVRPPAHSNGNAFGLNKRAISTAERINNHRKRISESVFVIQTSSNLVNWVDLTTVTNRTGITEFFEDFTADTNLVYRVVTIPNEGAEPVNSFGSQTQAGARGTTDLLPIVYEGDLSVRGHGIEVNGAEDGGTVITGNLIITGSFNRVSNITVLGRVMIRGNGNTLENVEHEGTVINAGRANRF